MNPLLLLQVGIDAAIVAVILSSNSHSYEARLVLLIQHSLLILLLSFLCNLLSANKAVYIFSTGFCRTTFISKFLLSGFPAANHCLRRRPHSLLLVAIRWYLQSEKPALILVTITASFLQYHLSLEMLLHSQHAGKFSPLSGTACFITQVSSFLILEQPPAFDIFLLNGTLTICSQKFRQSFL